MQWLLLITLFLGLVVPEAFGSLRTSAQGPTTALPVVTFQDSMRQWDVYTHFDHFWHEERIACTICHHSDSRSPQKQECMFCHGPKSGGAVPDYASAVHAKCNQCHANLLSQPERCGACHLPKEN